MASLARLAALRLGQRSPAKVAGVRAMSGDIFRDGPPTTTLGGAFKYPSGDPPPSNEEISGWVKKEMAKGWQSQGWDNYDKQLDQEWHVLMSIVLVSIPVLIGWVWCYQPESGKMNDWAIREAYLLLREREKAGVEPISKDLIDPAKLLAHLPSDEELKEAGVVINI